MPPTRTPKKSESIEIRIPFATKQAFMARCRDEGRSASEVLRLLIDGRLDDGAARRRSLRRRLQLALAAALAAALGAAAAPSFARPAADGEFQRLDANHDGVIDRTEFQAGRRSFFAR